MSTPKGTPLSKEEVSLLIDLIEGNKIITSRATNAANNQLKEATWLNITEKFNASVSSCPRRMEQLKLKWENLKKAARKRSASIRLSLNKTGGGQPDYIPPDDGLDRVASILGATCEGYSVPYGGDAETAKDAISAKDAVVILAEFSGGETTINNMGEEGDGDGVGGININQPVTKNKFLFNTPRSNNESSKRKRKLEEADIKARITRNEAITNYYNEKKKKMELEVENLELSNRKLKMELENFNK